MLQVQPPWAARSQQLVFLPLLPFILSTELQRSIRCHQPEQCAKLPSTNQTYTLSPADGIGIGELEL